MNDDCDELDRALFALPLDEPPAGLRAGILAATLYAPAIRAPILRPWEVALVGGLLALAVLLALAAGRDPRLFAGLLTAVRALTAPSTLAWLAAGVSTALWLSLINLAPLRPFRSGRS